MSFKDKVINLVIRGRDFFTPEAIKTARSMEDVGEASDKLNMTLAKLRDTSKELAKANELEQYGETLKAAVGEAQAELARLSEQMEKTPGASRELKEAFRQTASEVNELENEIASAGTKFDDLGRDLSRAGVDVSKYTEEQRRLRTESAQLAQELTRLKTAQRDALQLDELRTNVKLAKDEFERTEKALKALSEQFTATAKPTQQLKDAHALAKSEAQRAATAYQKLNRDLEQHEAALEKVGLSTEDLGAAEKKLADEIGQAQIKMQSLAKAQKDLAAYDRLTPQLERQRAALEKAKASLSSLSDEVKQAETPQEALAEQLGKAARLAGQAQIAYERNEARLNSLKETLSQAGINTSKLASEQQRLADAKARATVEAGKQSALLQQLRQKLDSTAQGAQRVGASIGSMAASITAAAGAYIGIDRLWASFKGVINTGGDFEVLREQLIGVFGDVQQGEKAFEWAVNLNKRLPTSLNDVLQAFVMLRNNGMDPMDGTLEKMINANVRYGKGAETLIPIIRQLTQSWSKNRIQAEEAYVLIENGLPVWNLLAEATGRNVAELMKMSEQGKLTREYMVALLDTMGKAGAGVVERRMQTWNALVTKFRDGLDQVQDKIAQSGALDYLKEQLGLVNKEMGEMADDGRLAKIGTEFSELTRNVIEGGKELAKTLYEWRGGIELVAKAWLMFKGLSMAKDIADLGTSIKDKLLINLIEAQNQLVLTGTKGKEAKQKIIDLTSGVGKLSTSVGIASQSLIGLIGSLGFGGLAIAAGAAGYALYDMSKKLYEVTVASKQHAEVAEQQRAALRAQFEQASQLTALYSKYKDTVLLTAEQIRYLSEAERLRYQESLAGMRNYLIAQEQQNAALKAAGVLTKEQELATSEGLKKVEQGLQAFARGTEQAMEQASKSVDDYVADIEHAKSVAQGLADGSLSKVFADVGLDLDQISGKVGKVVQEFGKGLETMAQASSMNGEAIQGYLSKAFDSTKNEAEIQAIIDKMELLHNQGKLVGQPWVESLGLATDAAKKLSKESVTGSELYQAMLKKQRTAANEAYKAGTLGAEEHARVVGALNQEMDKTEKLLRKQTRASTDLEQAFSTLGVKSAAALQQQADAARQAYQTISTTTTSIERQKEAFLAYAKAELEAAAANNRYVDGALMARAASLGLSDELKALATTVNTTGSEALITAKALDTMGASAASAQTQAQAAMQYQSASNKAQLANIEKLQQGTQATQATMVKFATETVSANDMAGMSIDQLRQKMADYQALLVKSKEYLHKSNDEWWSDQVLQQLAAQKTNAAIAAQVIKVKELEEALKSSSAPSAELIENAERALSGMTRLDKASLANLRAAIDSARQKMDALSDSARDTLGSLQDELDQYNDNMAAVEERRYQNQLADLRTKLTEAEAAKNDKAVADYQQAIKLAEQLHQQKLRDIAEEKAAKAADTAQQQQAASQQSGAPSSSSTYRAPQNQQGDGQQVRRIVLETGGKQVELQGTDQAAEDLEAMLRNLNMAGRVRG
ncbi:MAG: tape measure protein [Aeromonas sobria]